MMDVPNLGSCDRLGKKLIGRSPPVGLPARAIACPARWLVVVCRLRFARKSLLSESEDLLTYLRDNERDVCRQPLKEAARV